MNKFANICAVPQLSGSKTRFYSIHFEGKDTDETEDFFLRHEEAAHLTEAMEEILAWIDGIANDTGALEILFRQERKASALPPENLIRKRQKKRFHIQYQEINRLRLYLIRLNNAVVILLNGGEKTKQDPEVCPNVRRYFLQAQIIANAIDEALQNKDIIYNSTHTDIIIQPGFEIQIR